MEGPVGDHLHRRAQVTAGSHEVKVEYYENGGDAVAKVAVTP
jgi:hypothetical protein